MPTETRMIARIQMLQSGARGWTEAAETIGLDGEAIDHVREAQDHARQALELLDADSKGGR